MLIPGNFGLEFFTQLPEIVPDLPIIVISERSFSPAVGHKLSLKVVASLKKPLEYETLLACISRAYELGKRLRRTARRPQAETATHG